MKRGNIIFVAVSLTVIASAWLLMTISPPEHHPDYYLSRAVIAPLPATLHHVKTIGLTVPLMGDGFCTAAYSVTPEDFARLFQARPWSVGLITGNSDMERRFRAVWPGTPTPFEAYHFTIDEWRYVDMAVSTDHTKIIFYLPL